MNYPRIFLLTAIVYAIAGMLLGAVMHYGQTYTLIPVHSHVNGLGWLSLALFGLIHRLYPALANDPLARWHFWLANAGILLLTGGLWLFLTTGGMRVFLNAGVALTPLSFALFFWLFWRHRETA